MTAPTLTAPIPLIDLGVVHQPIADELRAAFERVFTSGSYTSGAEVAAFEGQLAEYLGVGRALGVGSGTSAIQLMLMAAGIGPGDEVIIPANTFWATAEGVHFTGATPVLVDVDPRTALMDPAAAEAAITERTAALLPSTLRPVRAVDRAAGRRPAPRPADLRGLRPGDRRDLRGHQGGGPRPGRQLQLLPRQEPRRPR